MSLDLSTLPHEQLLAPNEDIDAAEKHITNIRRDVTQYRFSCQHLVVCLNQHPDKQGFRNLSYKKQEQEQTRLQDIQEFLNFLPSINRAHYD